MCRVLGVSRSGFYAWRSRDASAAEQRREELTEEVKEIHAEVKARYGSPRIHAELVGRGHACSVNFVAQVMREAGIAAKTRRKFRQTTDSNHSMPVAENVLDREFDPEEPNTRWCADITYIPTREGWLYLAVVEDLFSRRIVGWSMDKTMTSRLVVDALEMALARRLSLRGSSSSGLVAHSDRGSQYAGEHYRRRLREERIACSMSRRGDCWDNAPMESFFASLKTEATTTACRGPRCCGRYNTPGDRLPVGVARTGTLVPGVPGPQLRRIRTVSEPAASAPPRT